MARAGANRTHQDGNAVPNGFEDRGAHQIPFRPHMGGGHRRTRASPFFSVTPARSQCSSTSRAYFRDTPSASLAWARVKGLFVPRGGTRIHVFAEEYGKLDAARLASVREVVREWKMEPDPHRD